MRAQIFSSLILLSSLSGTPLASTSTAEVDANTNPAAINAETTGSTAKLELKPTYSEYSASINKGLPINGTAIRRLTLADDGSWVYEFNVDSFVADIRENSRFQWDGQTIKPTQYHYSLSGWAIKDRDNSLSFDWSKGTAHNRYKKRDYELDIPEHPQDRLSYQLQLRMDLLQGKSDMTYNVLGRGKTKQHHFQVIGEDMLKTGGTEIKTVVVEKVRDEGKSRETTLWFAKDWDYMLVKFLQIEPDGETYEIMLKKATVGDRTFKIQN